MNKIGINVQDRDSAEIESLRRVVVWITRLVFEEQTLMILDIFSTNSERRYYTGCPVSNRQYYEGWSASSWLAKISIYVLLAFERLLSPQKAIWSCYAIHSNGPLQKVVSGHLQAVKIKKIKIKKNLPFLLFFSPLFLFCFRISYRGAIPRAGFKLRLIWDVWFVESRLYVNYKLRK